MEIVLNKIITQIHHQEDKLSSQMMRTVDEAFEMTLFLKEMLSIIKARVLQDSFADEQQEIDFFKNIKPQILGKLIYYNKIFRIETTLAGFKPSRAYRCVSVTASIRSGSLYNVLSNHRVGNH